MPRRDYGSPDQVTRLGDAPDLLAALIAVGLIVLVYEGRASLPRILLALGFAFLVTGRAIVANWPRMAAWAEAAMPMVFSLAVITLTAMVALWAHEWYPLRLFLVEAELSLAGLGLAAVRRHRAHAGARRDVAAPPAKPHRRADA